MAKVHTPEEIEIMMAQHYRNEVGRLVVHAEQAKGLPVTPMDVVEGMFPQDFKKQKEWLEKRLEELGGPQMTPALFGFDEGPVWPGFHNGRTWNGWAMPSFTKEVADQIIEHFNKHLEGDDPHSYYDESEDGYYLGWQLAEMEPDEDRKGYLWGKGANGLYPLGSGSLTWSLFTEDEGEESDRAGDEITEGSYSTGGEQMGKGILVEVAQDQYTSDSGHRMQRESGETPNGNPLNGRWVLRGPEGEFIDFDQYHSDLAERHGFVCRYKC